jgi:hypothetical protein
MAGVSGTGGDAGGGGGGGPDGQGGGGNSGYTNASSGGDGSDSYPVGFTAAGGGSYGAGYASITYPGFYGILFTGGDITVDPDTGDVTHVFYIPGTYTMSSLF